MTFAAVTVYNVSLFLHVTAVVVGFGATFAESLAFPMAMRLDRRHLPYVHRLSLAINSHLASPALLVILATGIYQVVDADWDMGSFWISATFAIVIVLGGLVGGFLIPADRRLGAMAAREIEAARDGEVVLSEEYRRGARMEAMIGALAGLLVIVAVFLMVTKLGG